MRYGFDTLRRLGVFACVTGSVAFASAPAEAASAVAEGEGQAASSLGFVMFAPLAALVAFVVSVALLRHRQKRERHHLVRMLLTDGLTGLANRRRLDTDLDRCVDADLPIAVAMIDIDLFKQLNDRQGHVAGDVVLQRVADTIAASVRQSDVVYRYGGEEFCVLLPGASEANALGVIERVRAQVEKIDFSDLGESVTVSAGVASGPGEDVRDFLYQADRALYSAKEAGRNRVLVASSYG